MIYMFLAPGFEIAEAMTPYDILLRAGGDVKLISITKDLAVPSAQGVKVVADLAIDQLDGSVPEMVILPGGMPGAKNLFENETVRQYVLDAAMRGHFIGAICAAPFILGRLGLLEGKTATCYPGFEDQLTGAALGGKVERDGNIITACGMGVALNFGYALASALFGKEKADLVMKQILAE